MKRVIIVGASGYGNVGDDSYAFLYRTELSHYDVLIYNSDLPEELPPHDLLVIGGGGLLHTQPGHFEKMTWYLNNARQKGIPTGFSSVGFQYDPKTLGVDWKLQAAECWKPFLEQAKFVTVRSPNDLQRAAELGIRAQYFPDLCYLMRRHIPKNLPCNHKVLVIVPGAGVFRYDPNAQSLMGLQESCTQRYVRGWLDAGGRLEVVRMGAPNDTVIHLKRLRHLYKGVPVYDEGNPKECLRRIAGAGQVISGRYHGMIFARCAGVPCYTVPLAPYKIVSEPPADTPDNMMRGAAHHLEVLRNYL